MTLTRCLQSRPGFSRLVGLVACAAFCGACGPEGAGTIHVESSQARRQKMQTGMGPTSTGVVNPASSSMPRTTGIRPAPRNRVVKKR